MNCIITTSINAPTEAIQKFDAMEDWHLIVAGDRKTPADYQLVRGTYLSPEDQELMDPELSHLLGWNCVERRNFAAIKAHEMGAKIVAIVDDDNIPYENWGRNLFVGRDDVRARYYETTLPAFDPFIGTNHPELWHRGYPFALVPQRRMNRMTSKTIRCDVQADFWDGAPDIDAVCRMLHPELVEFSPLFFPIASNRPSPFNSQNTFMDARYLRDYFLAPSFGRQSDIWAGWMVQAAGARVVYGRPSVFQDRNPHDLLGDLAAEVFDYTNSRKVFGHDGRIDEKAITRAMSPDDASARVIYRWHFMDFRVPR